jgi:hypothetical protein
MVGFVECGGWLNVGLIMADCGSDQCFFPTSSRKLVEENLRVEEDLKEGSESLLIIGFA